jgi:hypothetical protein
MKLTSHQRSTGNAVEHQVAKCLLKMGFKPSKNDAYTKTRLKEVFRGVKVAPFKMCQALKHILPAKKCYFSMMPDTSGSSTSHARTTSDIIVHSNPPLHISIKHNNLSLKHQKASNLWSQMRMCESRKCRFLAAYERIETGWHAKWSRSGYLAFNELPPEAKKDLYDQVNELTVKHLMTGPKRDVQGYINFILDLPSQNKFILKCDANKNKVQLLQLKVPDDVVPTKVERQGNFVQLHLGPKICIRMRLHSCKTNVTKTIGLKYDTQIHGGGITCIASY